MTSKIWTAAELEKMDPADVSRLFDESIVWDPADAPQDLLDRSKARVLQRIEQADTPELS